MHGEHDEPPGAHVHALQPLDQRQLASHSKA
jgi:hypothetical protein